MIQPEIELETARRRDLAESRAPRLSPLERVLALTHAIALLGILAGVITRAGWPAAALASFGPALIFTVHTWRARDAETTSLYLIALFAGFTELFADLWLVRSTGTLVYPNDGRFMLLASPSYMPFAWAGVVTGLLFAGGRIHRRIGGARAALLTAALAAVYVPAFEWAACAAGFWVYKDVASLDGVPVYIVAGEALLALPLAWLGANARRLRPAMAALAGVTVGLWIWASYALALFGERLARGLV